MASRFERGTSGVINNSLLELARRYGQILPPQGNEQPTATEGEVLESNRFKRQQNVGNEALHEAGIGQPPNSAA
jgi:hypothetical protein